MDNAVIMSLLSQIESLLFVASRPLSMKEIAKAAQKNVIDVKEALETLKVKYNQEASGIHILTEGEQAQMASNSGNAEMVSQFVKDEVTGELTRAQLEALTVIAYRSPITRPELEQIRGVNCALILRNLLWRGLIEEKDDENKILPVYSPSFETLRHLGVNSIKELADYETLHSHEFIEKVLDQTRIGVDYKQLDADGR